VFVSRQDRGLAIRSFDDPLLHQAKIGVQLIGDGYANTPPAHALAFRKIIDNYAFPTSAHSGPPGALLTFTPLPGYPAYAKTAAPWGLTTLENQQLDGLLMWVPGGVPYLIASLALLAAWLRTAEGLVRRWES
jgi:Cytochrome c oxidase caa3 assembly factor (Caa3_CtaG)